MTSQHWIRFDLDGTVKFGLLKEDSILVHEGDLFDRPRSTGEEIALGRVAILPPTDAGKMVALWNNSQAMATKTGQTKPAEPLYFIKANGSYLGSGGVIRKPRSYDGKVVFEGELGIVIGQTCRHVSEAEASLHIFGYTCINDVTAVGILGKDPSFQQWTRAKSFDTFGVAGPVVATGLDVGQLSIQEVLNEQERQNYSVTDLFFSPPEIVSLISEDMTLDPGDIICCGTSVGVGSMKPGSAIEITIDGIGTLRNRYEE